MLRVEHLLGLQLGQSNLPFLNRASCNTVRVLFHVVDATIANYVPSYASSEVGGLICIFSEVFGAINCLKTQHTCHVHYKNKKHCSCEVYMLPIYYSASEAAF